MNKCWIFDIDKTIADNSGRESLIPRRGWSTKHFSKYNKACIHDKPIENIIELVRSLSKSGFKIILVTGRCADSESETRQWLSQYDVPFDELYMRAVNDNRNAITIKADIFARISATNQILGAFDDDPKLTIGLSRLGYSMILVTS
ncbi:HAD family acid phosphatase [Vibrio navarrensis]|uniref:phosphatase domain-containing protein n=1 Tax=Vibrio navarrensis TaxID=29495 RepID=UPI00051D4BC1|nr:HAD family acid phosphatase [Vibrio navarrensis]KGK17696.1 hypothetical protein EA25_12425 [Vibrio navarrensis]MBE4575522.1 hypothetical protein [Vibrio navarrensis]